MASKGNCIPPLSVTSSFGVWKWPLRYLHAGSVLWKMLLRMNVPAKSSQFFLCRPSQLSRPLSHFRKARIGWVDTRKALNSFIVLGCQRPQCDLEVAKPLNGRQGDHRGSEWILKLALNSIRTHLPREYQANPKNRRIVRCDPLNASRKRSYLRKRPLRYRGPKNQTRLIACQLFEKHHRKPDFLQRGESDAGLSTRMHLASSCRVRSNLIVMERHTLLGELRIISERVCIEAVWQGLAAVLSLADLTHSR